MPEDFPVNEALYVVHAEDEDLDHNAELSYTLDTSSQPEYGELFTLHRTTGQVRPTDGTDSCSHLLVWDS